MFCLMMCSCKSCCKFIASRTCSYFAVSRILLSFVIHVYAWHFMDELFINPIRVWHFEFYPRSTWLGGSSILFSWAHISSNTGGTQTRHVEYLAGEMEEVLLKGQMYESCWRFKTLRSVLSSYYSHVFHFPLYQREIPSSNCWFTKPAEVNIRFFKPHLPNRKMNSWFYATNCRLRKIITFAIALLNEMQTKLEQNIKDWGSLRATWHTERAGEIDGDEDPR
jgi:hypothetical protein